MFVTVVPALIPVPLTAIPIVIGPTILSIGTDVSALPLSLLTSAVAVRPLTSNVSPTAGCIDKFCIVMLVLASFAI